jgi:hypothetical protein
MACEPAESASPTPTVAPGQGPRLYSLGVKAVTALLRDAPNNCFCALCGTIIGKSTNREQHLRVHADVLDAMQRLPDMARLCVGPATGTSLLLPLPVDAQRFPSLLIRHQGASAAAGPVRAVMRRTQWLWDQLRSRLLPAGGAPPTTVAAPATADVAHDATSSLTAAFRARCHALSLVGVAALLSAGTQWTSLFTTDDANRAESVPRPAAAAASRGALPCSVAVIRHRSELRRTHGLPDQYRGSGTRLLASPRSRPRTGADGRGGPFVRIRLAASTPSVATQSMATASAPVTPAAAPGDELLATQTQLLHPRDRALLCGPSSAPADQPPAQPTPTVPATSPAAASVSPLLFL